MNIHELIRNSIYRLDSGFASMEHPDKKPYTICYRPFNIDEYENKYEKEVRFSEARLKKEDGFSGWPGVLVSWWEDGETREVVLFDIELTNKYLEIKERLQKQYHSIVNGN